MCFVQYCTQNELIADQAPVYLYEAIIRLKFTVSIRFMAVNITAVNLQVWGLDGTGVLPVQTILYGYSAQPYSPNKLYYSYIYIHISCHQCEGHAQEFHSLNRSHSAKKKSKKSDKKGIIKCNDEILTNFYITSQPWSTASRNFVA